jgi:hypothetical protein
MLPAWLGSNTGLGAGIASWAETGDGVTQGRAARQMKTAPQHHRQAGTGLLWRGGVSCGVAAARSVMPVFIAFHRAPASFLYRHDHPLKNIQPKSRRSPASACLWRR